MSLALVTAIFKTVILLLPLNGPLNVVVPFLTELHISEEEKQEKKKNWFRFFRYTFSHLLSFANLLCFATG